LRFGRGVLTREEVLACLGLGNWSDKGRFLPLLLVIQIGFVLGFALPDISVVLYFRDLHLRHWLYLSFSDLPLLNYSFFCYFRLLDFRYFFVDPMMLVLSLSSIFYLLPIHNNLAIDHILTLFLLFFARIRADSLKVVPDAIAIDPPSEIADFMRNEVIHFKVGAKRKGEEWFGTASELVQFQQDNKAEHEEVGSKEEKASQQHHHREVPLRQEEGNTTDVKTSLGIGAAIHKQQYKHGIDRPSGKYLLTFDQIEQYQRVEKNSNG
jgi:hypothetical protein